MHQDGRSWYGGVPTLGRAVLDVVVPDVCDQEAVEFATLMGTQLHDLVEEASLAPDALGVQPVPSFHVGRIQSGSGPTELWVSPLVGVQGAHHVPRIAVVARGTVDTGMVEAVAVTHLLSEDAGEHAGGVRYSRVSVLKAERLVGDVRANDYAPEGRQIDAGVRGGLPRETQDVVARLRPRDREALRQHEPAEDPRAAEVDVSVGVVAEVVDHVVEPDARVREEVLVEPAREGLGGIVGEPAQQDSPRRLRLCCAHRTPVSILIWGAFIKPSCQQRYASRNARAALPSPPSDRCTRG